MIAPTLSCYSSPIHLGATPPKGREGKNDSRSGSGLPDHLSVLLTEGSGEESTIVLDDEIPEPRLSSELVNSLGDLVSGSVSESWEEGEELLSRSSVDGLSEDDAVEVSSVNLREDWKGVDERSEVSGKEAMIVGRRRKQSKEEAGGGRREGRERTGSL